MLILSINRHTIAYIVVYFEEYLEWKVKNWLCCCHLFLFLAPSVLKKLSTNNPRCSLEGSRYSLMYIFRDVSTKFTINFKLPTWWHHKGMFVSILSEKWPINLWFLFIVLSDKLIPLGGYGVLLQRAPTISKREFCAHLADKVKSNQRV